MVLESPAPPLNPAGAMPIEGEPNDVPGKGSAPKPGLNPGVLSSVEPTGSPTPIPGTVDPVCA